MECLGRLESAGLAPGKETKVDIFAAVARNDVAGIRCAIAEGTPVDGKRGDGLTPLLWACSYFAIDSIRTLLELGADPDLPSDDNMIVDDYAQNNLDIEELVLDARRRRRTVSVVSETAAGRVKSCIASDLAEFLDGANLVLPESGIAFLRARNKERLGDERAQEIERYLEETNYRVLLEQTFGSEALACAYATADYKAFRSPMLLGKYAVGHAKRRPVDYATRVKNLYEATDKLLWRLLPNELFAEAPKRICEIGGAWGATMKHLTERFSPEAYLNYEPDRYYAEWTKEKFGAITMPVDGETLRGTDDDSINVNAGAKMHRLAGAKIHQ